MCGAATYLMLTYTASVYELSNAAYMLPPLLYPFCICVLWLSAKCALRTRLGKAYAGACGVLYSVVAARTAEGEVICSVSIYSPQRRPIDS